MLYTVRVLVNECCLCVINKIARSAYH